MKVTELTAWVVRVPLKKRIKHASHERTETDNVLVRVRLNDDSVGWGEGVPREYVTGESADSALDLLKTTDLKAQLGECRDYVEALRLIERFQPAVVSGDAEHSLKVGSIRPRAHQVARLSATVRLTLPESDNPFYVAKYFKT